MADLVIRGMEMPHDCPHCQFAAIGYVSPMSTECTLYCRAVDKFKDCETVVIKEKSYEVLSQYDSRPDWCPLVPLPEGHGRIVDAAEILEKANNSPWFDGDVSELGLLLGSEVTTIVPAEGGGEDGR